ncbi:MAG: aldose 1-epimerase family protein [Eubacteriales bacterium]|nr:aldose 1-epimerase family protein [Eubacteriales bacterium]
MLITLKNEQLTVVLDSAGAVFHSIVKDGIEYLWQGDKKYWSSRDKTLFPYVGRCRDGKYIYRGQEYTMPLHGFAPGSEFEAEQLGDSSVCFTLRANEMTREYYPFEFVFKVLYELDGCSISKKCTVINKDSKTIHFGFGAHPGFNVPLSGEGDFSDWYMEFDADCQPYRVEFDPVSCLLSGRTLPYPLKKMNTLPLYHEMFNDDAVVLGNVPRGVTLKSDKSRRSVHVSFPGMEFVGFWHARPTDAPYVCIEPWATLPSHNDFVEDIEKQEYILHLPAGETYTNVMMVEIR